MSKNGLILTSLVGAIPGLIMAVLMVMAFINYAGGQSVFHKILCVLLLLIGLLLAAMPVGIFVLAGPKAEKAPAKKKDEEEEVADAASGEVVEAAEASSGELVDEAEHGAVTDPNLVVEEGPPDEFAVTGEFVAEEESASSSAELVADDDFDFDEPEDKTPKKGKKK